MLRYTHTHCTQSTSGQAHRLHSGKWCGSHCGPHQHKQLLHRIVDSTGSPIFSFVSIWSGLNLADRHNTGLPLSWPIHADLLQFLSPLTLSSLTCGPTLEAGSLISLQTSACLTEAWQQSCMHPRYRLSNLRPVRVKVGFPDPSLISFWQADPGILQTMLSQTLSFSLSLLAVTPLILLIYLSSLEFVAIQTYTLMTESLLTYKD